MNAHDVIGTFACLQGWGIPLSLIHMNKQPDHHKDGFAPTKQKQKTSLWRKRPKVYFNLDFELRFSIF